MTTLPVGRKCLKIGIWCAYHTTLEASEGIGVFAHNLARGLAALPAGPEVVLCIRPGDERLVQETASLGEGRVRIACLGKPPRWSRSFTRKLGRWNQRLQRWNESLTRRLQTLRQAMGSAPSSAPLRRLAELTLQAMRSPIRLAARHLAAGHRKRVERPDAHTQQIIDTCDVWVLPYFGIDLQFSQPTVVVVHDLVFFHYPDAVATAQRSSLQELSRRVAQRSTLVACMSHFIRDNDLLGVLRLPEEKVRVLQPAAPRDFSSLLEDRSLPDRYPVLNREFLFYPAAFRSYKNHALLVDALAHRRDAGDENLHLVFTGIQEPPADLQRQIISRHLENRVHILGKVAREALLTFYARARATIVPSFYEQGSFPIMEAIRCGCPVACSRIPSLVELFAPMGSAMPFFDPADPEDLAAVIGSLLARRSEIQAMQQSASRQLFARTWEQAAQEWLDVFHEAIELHTRMTAAATNDQRNSSPRQLAAA